MTWRWVVKVVVLVFVGVFVERSDGDEVDVEQLNELEDDASRRMEDQTSERVGEEKQRGKRTCSFRIRTLAPA